MPKRELEIFKRQIKEKFKNEKEVIMGVSKNEEVTRKPLVDIKNKEDPSLYIESDHAFIINFFPVIDIQTDKNVDLIRGILKRENENSMLITEIDKFFGSIFHVIVYKDDILEEIKQFNDTVYLIEPKPHIEIFNDPDWRNYALNTADRKQILGDNEEAYGTNSGAVLVLDATSFKFFDEDVNNSILFKNTPGKLIETVSGAFEGSNYDVYGDHAYKVTGVFKSILRGLVKGSDIYMADAITKTSILPEIITQIFSFPENAERVLVINCSFSSYRLKSFMDTQTEVLSLLFNEYNERFVFVVAMGNSGEEVCSTDNRWPQNYIAGNRDPWRVRVAGRRDMKLSDIKASGSFINDIRHPNSSYGLPCTDIVAPFSWYSINDGNLNDVTVVTGTSFSAPIISSVILLVAEHLSSNRIPIIMEFIKNELCIKTADGYNVFTSLSDKVKTKKIITYKWQNENSLYTDDDYVFYSISDNKDVAGDDPQDSNSSETFFLGEVNDFLKDNYIVIASAASIVLILVLLKFVLSRVKNEPRLMLNGVKNTPQAGGI